MFTLTSDQTVDMARRVSKKRPTYKKRATKRKTKRTTKRKQAGRGMSFVLPWALKIQKEVPIIADKAFAAFKEAYNKKKT